MENTMEILYTIGQRLGPPNMDLKGQRRQKQNHPKWYVAKKKDVKKKNILLLLLKIIIFKL